LGIFKLKDYWRLKLPTNDLASNAQMPAQKHKKFEKTRRHDSQKLNSPVTNTNDNEVDEISNNFKKRL
jgi:hypothetical protein